MIDMGRSLKTAITTGKVVFGVQQAEKAVKSGEAKLLVVSNNCPSEFLMSKTHNVPVHVYQYGPRCTGWKTILGLGNSDHR